MPSPSSSDPASGGNFWEQAQHKKLNEREGGGGTPPPPKRRSKAKILLFVAGGLLLVTAGGVLALPAVASSIAPGMIASRSPQYMNGTATVSQTSFSWGGPQRIKGLKVVDKNNNFVASVDSVEVASGLLSLIRGNLDLGDSKIDGVKADIVKRADGKTNVESLAPQPPPAAKSEAASLPKGLQGKITLTNSSATFTDETTKSAAGTPTTASIKDFNATAQFGSNQPLKLSAKAATVNEATTGSISIDAVIDNWTNSDGAITPQAAKVDATVAIKNLPTALIDAFVPGLIKDGSMKVALGDTADINLTAKGSTAGGKADFTAVAPNAQLAAKLTLASNVITNDAPISVRVSSKGVEGFAPTLRQTLSQSNVTFASLPKADLTIDNVRFALPQTGKPMDLAGSGATIVATIAEMQGTVVLRKDASPSPFRIAPLNATIDARDLSKSVRLTAATDAQIDGNAAGLVNADIVAEGVLDASSKLGMPTSIKGDISLKGVNTAIAQPFVQALKLDLPNDVGPVLDAQIAIATDGAALPKGSTTPPADILLRVQSQHLNVDGAIRYTKERISAGEKGIRIAASRAAAMVGRFVSPDTGFAVLSSRNDAKGATINILTLDLPLNAQGQPDASKLVANMAIQLDGIALLPVKQTAGAVITTGQPLDIQTVSLAISAGNQGSVRGNIDGAVWHESKQFTLKGDFNIVNLLTNDAAGKLTPNLQAMKPTAQLNLTNLPVTIAHLLVPAAPAPGTVAASAAAPLDIAMLLQALAGDTLNLALTASSQASEGYQVGAAIRSERLTADLTAKGNSKRLDIGAMQAQATVTPQTVRTLLTTFAPDIQGTAQLASTNTLSIVVSPLSIPLTADNKADLAAVGAATAKISLPGRTLISGLTRKDKLGRPIDLGTFGVQDFNIDASFPVAALIGPAPIDKRATTLKLAGTILGGAQVTPIGVLTADVVTSLSDKKPAGPIALKLKLDRIDTLALERIAGSAGMVSGALGENAVVVLDANVQPPANAAGAPFDFNQATTTALIQITAPKLQTSGPISATISPAAITLNKPSKLTLSVDPAWANQMFLTPASGTPSLTLRSIAPIALTLDQFHFPRTGATGAAAKVEAALSLAVASMAIATADGKNLAFGPTTAQVRSRPPGPGGTPIDFNLGISQLTVGDGAPASDMAISGTIDNIISPDGTVNAANAVVNTRADLPRIPTVLIDALTTKDGTVVDALGALAAVTLNVERYPLDGQPALNSQPPLIELTAKSERAEASLKGTVRDGMYVSQAPFTARVSQVTQALSARFIKALPVLGTFEKTSADAPAALEVTNITAPLGKDFSKLNADIIFDPGEARFGTSSAFGELLKVVNSRTAGQVGQKLEPLTMQVRSGIATYQRWRVPLGEFVVETEGTVNLVNRTVDVVTYIPIGAVSDKVSAGLGGAGGLGKLLPGVLDAASLVPFRTSGSMDNPTTRVDPELMARNAVKAIDPEKLIKDNLKDLFKPKAPASPTSPIPPK